MYQYTHWLILFLIVFYVWTVLRNPQADTTPGNLDSCMALVQRTLPIALARPFVEQFVPEGTKVGSIHTVELSFRYYA